MSFESVLPPSNMRQSANIIDGKTVLWSDLFLWLYEILFLYEMDLFVVIKDFRTLSAVFSY